MIRLGDLVRDKITGFKGIAVGRTEWLNGCVRYGIQPKEMKDSKPVESQWFDQEQIEIVKPQAYDVKPKPTGGPQRDPRPLSCPSR